MNVLLDSIVKELKKSTNIDFEKDSYSEIRDVVTTIVHDHMDAATPIEVDAHVMSIEKETSRGESEEYEDEEGRLTPTRAKNREEAGRPNDKSNEKGNFDGACYICGKTSH